MQKIIQENIAFSILFDLNKLVSLGFVRVELRFINKLLLLRIKKIWSQHLRKMNILTIKV